MRVNIVGVGRFTISLYGEAKRGIKASKVENESLFIKREKVIVSDYMSGLRVLSAAYNDEHLLNFVDDFQSSDLYKEAFDKSVRLAELRNVPENQIRRSKAEIDSYFQGGPLK